MKQRRLLTAVAVFIALYMTAALGWWTYSLMKYSNVESALQLELLENKKLLCNQHFQSQNITKIESDIEDFFICKISATDFNNLSKSARNYANYYQVDLNMELRKSTPDSLWVKISFSIPRARLTQIAKKLNSKQTAWLGEGITVGILTLIIIGLMYYFLEKIIRFNQQKTNFMMAVTHELKTPIAAAKLAIQTVIRNKNQENQQRVLEISKQSIERLSGMMERVLMATQFENNIPTKSTKWIRLHEVIERAIDEVQSPHTQELKNNLVQSKDFLILCDEHMLKIVFINLFTNSIKYSDENCVNVSVKSFVRDGVFGVTVSDQGIGIPVNERNHIFEKFYRIGDERTRSKQGSGLGLYLVKQILQLHKASIEVTSNSPNGSNFNIVFNANDCRME
jgi:signal transduction histidine kinase